MAKRCLTLPWCFAIAVAMACCGFAVGKFLGTLQGAVKLTSVSMRARTAADSILDVGKEVAARNDAALFRRFLDDAYGFFMVYMNDENEERRRTAVDEWQDKYGGLRRQNVVPPSAEEIVREERRARLPSALCGLAFPVIPEAGCLVEDVRILDEGGKRVRIRFWKDRQKCKVEHRVLKSIQRHYSYQTRTPVYICLEGLERDGLDEAIADAKGIIQDMEQEIGCKFFDAGSRQSGRGRPAFERRFSLLGVQGSVTAEDSECGKHFVKVVITRHCSRFEDNAYNEGVENLGE